MSIMRFCNIKAENGVHLCVEENGVIRDLTAAGFAFTMDEVISGKGNEELKAFLNKGLPVVEGEVEFANVVNKIGKLLCVGLNYRAHAEGAKEAVQADPVIFCKVDNSLTYAGASVELPAWEYSYDYEAELVAVIGRTAWGVSEEEAGECIFGYTCGNDFSCRVPQKRSGQWLIGKSMPGFGPCGPYIAPASEFKYRGRKIQSYVNGELRQNGNTDEMIFSCERIVSYVSKYIRLEPGDLIFTGTPSGVELEKAAGEQRWLVPGDKVDVVIEGLGTLTTYMV